MKASTRQIIARLRSSGPTPNILLCREAADELECVANELDQLLQTHSKLEELYQELDPDGEK